MNNITAFEHDWIYVGEGENELKYSEFKSLERFFKYSKTDMFTIGNKAVKFKQYVGVLKVGETYIKVLPKIGQSHKGDWERLLFEMIINNKQIPKRFQSSIFSLNNNIIDIYIWELVREVESIFRTEIRKGYNLRSKNSTSIKGKINFTKDVTVNHSDKSKKYIIYEEFNNNILENCIIYSAVVRAMSLTVNPHLIDALKEFELLFDLRDVKTINYKKILRYRPNFNRNNVKYKNAIELSRVIILGENPDGVGVDTSVVSFLFDMNKLYEDYVYNLLKKQLTQKGISVKREIREFWENKRIKPDIVIRNGKKTFVLDTKWKDVALKGVSDGDLKQMYIYNLYWNCSEAVLLYPSGDIHSKKVGGYREAAFMSERNIHSSFKCSTYEIPLFDSEGKVAPHLTLEPILKFIQLNN